MNIAEVFRQQARQRPDAAAIIDVQGGRPRVTTFAELDRQSARAAGLLAGHELCAVYLPCSLAPRLLCLCRPLATGHCPVLVCCR